MTRTPQPETTGFKQRLARAESELARFIAQEKQVALQLQADQAELQTLETAIAAHDLQRQTIQDTIDARRTALREAEAQSLISEGTLSEKPDLKNLERLLKQSQSEQLAILDKLAKEEQAQERRRCALSDAIDTHYQTLSTLAENKEAMEAAKSRVWREFGQSEYDMRLARLNALQEALSHAEQAVQQAREDIDDFSTKALESLKDWPEIQGQLSAILPFSNTTTTVIEAALGLLDILLGSNHDIERLDTILLREAGINYRSLEHLLSWSTPALYPILYHHTNAEPVELQQAKTDLSNLLDVYLAHKKKEVRR